MLALISPLQNATLKAVGALASNLSKASRKTPGPQARTYARARKVAARGPPALFFFFLHTIVARPGYVPSLPAPAPSGEEGST